MIFSAIIGCNKGFLQGPGTKNAGARFKAGRGSFTDRPKAVHCKLEKISRVLATKSEQYKKYLSTFQKLSDFVQFWSDIMQIIKHPIALGIGGRRPTWRMFTSSP